MAATQSASTSASSLPTLASPLPMPTPEHVLRKNEHVAVLLARHNWKPDSASSRCDDLRCKTRFSLFERRHHCRMCGGVFCGACTTRTTPLLDTSNLHFHLPPRGHTVHEFHSPASPVADLRVCDACHDTVHGIIPRLPLTDAVRPPRVRRSHPRAVPASPSPSSSASSTLHTPPDGLLLAPNRDGAVAPPPTRRSSGRKRTTSTATSTSALSPRIRAALLLPLGGPPLALKDVAPELATINYGALDAYPLRVPSAICKATGGGRWEPKPVPPVNVPYGRPGTEDFCGRPRTAEEVAEAARLENAVVVDGEFHIRYPMKPKPRRRS